MTSRPGAASHSYGQRAASARDPRTQPADHSPARRSPPTAPCHDPPTRLSTRARRLPRAHRRRPSRTLRAWVTRAGPRRPPCGCPRSHPMARPRLPPMVRGCRTAPRIPSAPPQAPAEPDVSRVRKEHYADSGGPDRPRSRLDARRDELDGADCADCADDSKRRCRGPRVRPSGRVGR
jgi:hypothetical protein